MAVGAEGGCGDRLLEVEVGDDDAFGKTNDERVAVFVDREKEFGVARESD